MRKFGVSPLAATLPLGSSLAGGAAVEMAAEAARLHRPPSRDILSLAGSLSNVRPRTPPADS